MQDPTTGQSPSSAHWVADHHSRQLGDHLNNSSTTTTTDHHNHFFLKQYPNLNAMPSPFLFPRESSDGGSGGSAVSSNYFGLAMDTNGSNPPGSDPGPHAKKNWESSSRSTSTPGSHQMSPVASPRHVMTLVGSQSPTSDRRSSANSCNRGSFSNFSASQPRSGSTPSSAIPQTPGLLGPHVNNNDMFTHPSPMQISPMEDSQRAAFSLPGFIRLPQTFSPDVYDSSSSVNPIDRLRTSDLSLPESTTGTSPSHPSSGERRRPETVPVPLDSSGITFASAEDCERLLRDAPENVLLLDIRPYPQFSQANIMESLNLCIPTTLLKRPSFNTDKLKDTFVNEAEKKKFLTWKNCAYIIVYDSNTEQMRDAGHAINVLKKFRVEGWRGEGKILRGGFATFSQRYPDRIRHLQQNSSRSIGTQVRPMSLNLASTVPVAGGCSMPDSAPAQPFFNNIRQNMDLVGGVGQLPVKLPHALTTRQEQHLPQWLRRASAQEDHGHDVSQKFLEIEQHELHRMREALNTNVNYNEKSSSQFRVAGIEKGSKNRYNDIYPFDHSRVHLKDIPSGSCDYINANHVRAKHSNKTYIATQAPIPDTFADFWRVIWENDVRVIVALTAEVERGQIKCHAYWNTNSYGPFKVKALGERRVYLDTEEEVRTPHQSSASGKKSPTEGFYSAGEDRPFVVVRHFSLSHSTYPFKPIREITQVQYSFWPDFGTTSQPSQLLKLVEQCNKIIRRSNGVNTSIEDAEPPGLRPVVVHCSAGCGRTGTFCTVDSVVDMIKQQLRSRRHKNKNNNDNNNDTTNDGNETWIYDDATDLIASTVEDFRTQRPSMVQNLSQFVLCYETVLEWVVLHEIQEQS